MARNPLARLGGGLLKAGPRVRIRLAPAGSLRTSIPVATLRPALTTSSRQPLHSTPQQHRMILISGSDQTSSRLPGPFSLFLPGSCPNNRNRCRVRGVSRVAWRSIACGVFRGAWIPIARGSGIGRISGVARRRGTRVSGLFRVAWISIARRPGISGVCRVAWVSFGRLVPWSRVRHRAFKLSKTRRRSQRQDAHCERC
jgi:hypothetical protein